MTPYEKLANAIIMQAVRDYRYALSLTTKEDVDCNGRVKLYERFFRSDWYETLTNLDGKMVIRRIRAEFGYDYK